MSSTRRRVNGSKIREARKAKKLTTTQLAARIGRSNVSMVGYESGRVNPPAEVVAVLARVLQTRSEELYEGGDEWYAARISQ